MSANVELNLFSPLKRTPIKEVLFSPLARVQPKVGKTCSCTKGTAVKTALFVVAFLLLIGAAVVGSGGLANYLPEIFASLPARLICAGILTSLGLTVGIPVLMTYFHKRTLPKIENPSQETIMSPYKPQSLLRISHGTTFFQVSSATDKNLYLRDYDSRTLVLGIPFDGGPALDMLDFIDEPKLAEAGSSSPGTRIEIDLKRTFLNHLSPPQTGAVLILTTSDLEDTYIALFSGLAIPETRSFTNGCDFILAEPSDSWQKSDLFFKSKEGLEFHILHPDSSSYLIIKTLN